MRVEVVRGRGARWRCVRSVRRSRGCGHGSGRLWTTTRPPDRDPGLPADRDARCRQDHLRAGPGHPAAGPPGRSTGSSSSARPIICARNGPTPRRGRHRPRPEDAQRAGPDTRRCPRLRHHLRAGGRPAGHPRRPLPAARTLVILDEIHHAGDGLSWGQATAEAFVDVHRRLSLSGTPFRTKPDERIPFVQYEIDGGVAVGGRLQLRLPAGAGRHRRAARGFRRLHRCLPVADQRGRGDRRLVDRREHHVGGGGRLEDGAGPGRRLGAARPRRHGRTDHPPARIGDAGRGRPSCWPATRTMPAPTPRSSGRSPGRSRRSSSPMIPPHPSGSNSSARSDQRIVVCVRMISEGVDIPRAACLAWMTTYRTPLFFAQAVGRVVRSRGAHETATVFLPAVRPLLALAAELEKDRNYVIAPPPPAERRHGRARPAWNPRNERRRRRSRSGVAGRVRPRPALRPGATARWRTPQQPLTRRRPGLPRAAGAADPGADRCVAGQPGLGPAPPGAGRGRGPVAAAGPVIGSAEVSALAGGRRAAA